MQARSLMSAMSVMTFTSLAMFVMAFTSPANVASAQQPCPCDCYFSFDCAGSAFCDYGNLSIEDSCLWRTPKPQGQVGAGCDQDYDDWGQCDGICNPPGLVQTFTQEHVGFLSEGISLWSDAFLTSARNGGGFPTTDTLVKVQALPFEDHRMPNMLGRAVVEILLISTGPDAVLFPDQGKNYLSHEVAMRDLSAAPLRVRAGELALQALVAEIQSAGAGQAWIQQIEPDALNAPLLANMCAGTNDVNDCLYQRVAVFGEAIGRGGRSIPTANLGGGGSSCADADEGDIDGDGVFDTADVKLFALAVVGAEVTPDVYDRCDQNDDGVLDGDDVMLYTVLVR